jgi:hypothetical protein
LSDLCLKAFVNGLHSPNDRPSALEWVRGLLHAWDLLVPCGNAKCTHKWFILADLKQPRCPFCGTTVRQPGPLLKLKRLRGKDQWLADGELAVYHNLSLFKWHVYTDILPGPEADRTPQAYFVLHQGQWLLINQQLDSLTSAAGNVVPPGQAVVLRPGEAIRLAQGDSGRSIEVESVGR